MPLDYLRKIKDAAFPLEVTDESEIRNVAVLAAAGFIEAALPPPAQGTCGQTATVLRITPLGSAELSRKPAGPSS